MLQKGLQKIVDSVEGTLGVTLIGTDGLPIAEAVMEKKIDIGILGAELTMLYKNAIKFVRDMEFGELNEVAVVADNVTILCRAVTEEYYLLLAMDSKALYGKGRYTLRKSVQEFKEQL